MQHSEETRRLRAQPSWPPVFHPALRQRLQKEPSIQHDQETPEKKVGLICHRDACPALRQGLQKWQKVQRDCTAPDMAGLQSADVMLVLP